MYGDNNATDTNNQPGDNTPPPMLDTPMSNDGSQDPPVDSGAPNDNTTSNDTDAGNYMMDDAPGMDLPDTTTPQTSNDAGNTGRPFDKDDELDRVIDEASTSHSDGTADADNSSSDDLLHLKQQALAQLTPLVDHLEQSPEDEFRTTMMMIQASDNKSLLPKAYAAAQKISDDKVKAQALLDIINEINYFTQHHDQ